MEWRGYPSTLRGAIGIRWDAQDCHEQVLDSDCSNVGHAVYMVALDTQGREWHHSNIRDGVDRLVLDTQGRKWHQMG